jgi:hydrogenase-4 membrane subunit HyfE
VISVINYAIPYLAVIMSLYVLLTRKIDTSCNIRAAKICLWVIIWVLLMWSDYEKSFAPVASITVARMIALAINILDIKEVIKYRVKKTEVNIAP